MRRWIKRLLLCAAIFGGVVAALSAIPIVGIEMSCKGEGPPPVARTPLVSDAGYRRAEGDSYMTYPEWYIGHAYTDLAAVTRQSSESEFGYLRSMRTFWTSLCHATATARSIGPVTFSQRMTDYIIGVSFSLEMAVQGVWEHTIGAITLMVNPGIDTPEDQFNLRFLDDYSGFLQQTPWYRYPFAATLWRFWWETPWSREAFARSLERRVALSLEYGGKALYAVPIGWLAGTSPADLTIESVVTDWHEGAKDETKVRDLSDGRILVRTPRYEAFTTILRGWTKSGTKVVEIAGNSHILATAIVPDKVTLSLPNAKPIFTIPIQSQPGQRRVRLDVEVPKITEVIAAVEQQGARFEHAYDY